MNHVIKFRKTLRHSSNTIAANQTPSINKIRDLLWRLIKLFSTNIHDQSVSNMPNYQPQNFDYFLVLDFEATCDRPQIRQHEIIEFPVLKLDCRTFEVVDTFHRYVKPTINPKLTPFCTELTGILQSMVDESDKFHKVFKDFQRWMMDTKLINENQTPLSRFTFITCGDWDLKIMLPLQCRMCNSTVPPYMRTWIDVKKSFSEHTNQWPKSQEYVLNYFRLEPVGRAHSGIDDCRNLVQIIQQLALRGFVFRNTARNFPA